MVTCARQGKRAKVILSNVTNVYKNLALEHWILNNWSFSKFDCLLIYRNKPCVVIGRFQNTWREVNVNRANREGQTQLTNLGTEVCTYIILHFSAYFELLADFISVGRFPKTDFLISEQISLSQNITEYWDVLLRQIFTGVSVARRVSGGGTVYHDLGNVNFSFFTDKPSHCPARNLEFLSRKLHFLLCLLSITSTNHTFPALSYQYHVN